MNLAILYVASPWQFLYCHMSIDEQGWKTIQMQRYNQKLFMYEINFQKNVEWVFCNDMKQKWLNPIAYLDSEFVKKAEHCNNFYIEKGGEYIISNGYIQKINTLQYNVTKQLCVINLEQCLLRDEVSLVKFNNIWSKNFLFNYNFKLVYITCLNLENILKNQGLVRAQYIIINRKLIFRLNGNGYYEMIEGGQIQGYQMMLENLKSLGKVSSQNASEILIEISDQQYDKNMQSIHSFTANCQIEVVNINNSYIKLIIKKDNLFTLIKKIQILEEKFTITSIIGSQDFKQVIDCSNIIILAANLNKKFKKQVLEGSKYKIVESQGQYGDSIIAYFQKILLM